jgi:hypothetical protein
MRWTGSSLSRYQPIRIGFKVPPANQNVVFKVPPAIVVEDKVDRILAKQVSTNQDRLKVPPANQNGVFKVPPAIVVEDEVDRILAKQESAN